MKGNAIKKDVSIHRTADRYSYIEDMPNAQKILTILQPCLILLTNFDDLSDNNLHHSENLYQMYLLIKLQEIQKN